MAKEPGKSGHEEKFRSPSLAADAVIQKGKCIVLIKRRFEPFRGRWAFPGGFVDYGERVEDAVIREAREETGLDIELVRLIGVYSDPDRDPRKHVAVVSYLARIAGGKPVVTDETTGIRVFEKIPEDQLAFDHAKVIRDAGLGHMLE